MKKQILILALLVLAIFASVNKSYGQTLAIAGSAPLGISCLDDLTHPIAGKPYTYTVVSNQTTGTPSFTFWATKDADFIATDGVFPATLTTTTNMDTYLKSPTTATTGTDLLVSGANYITPGTGQSLGLTWSTAILNGTDPEATPTFVVVSQDATATQCANNLKVWSIDPIKAFTVDIRNIDNAAPTGASLAYSLTSNEDQCMDMVRGATWVAAAGTPGVINYNYGYQVMYFEVIAANFSASWTPTFQIAGLGNGQTATFQQSIDKAFTDPTAAAAIVNGTPVVGSQVTTTVTNTSTGVSIYVKVTITNVTYEGIASTPITLTVDGENAEGDWDIANNTLTDLTPACGAATAADQNDFAIQTLNPRPDVTPAITDPVTPFNPSNSTN